MLVTCDTDCNNQQPSTIKMDKFQSYLREEFKQNSKTSYSIVKVILGGVMVDFGSNYTEDNLCPNGAARWFLIAGICLLVSNLINVLAKLFKKCAERDGKIDYGEMVVMDVTSFSSGVLTIVDFAMLIWGSIVVFGAWANWTDDFDAYKANPKELNFCEHTPMMTAFVFLILDWVQILIIACAWFVVFMSGFIFGASSSQQNQS